MNFRIEGQAAYVLHSRPYRETSLIVDLFTLEYGKCSVVVNGGRRPNSKFRALIQPYVPLQVDWRGRNELKTLSSAEPVGPMRFLSGNALICGLYVNELLERLLHPMDGHPKLFVYYQYVINALAEGDDIEGSLRTFEYQLLNALGYSFDLAEVSQSGHYRYRPGIGMQPLGRAPAKPDMNYFSGQVLVAIAENDYSQPEVLKAAKRLMRMALEPLLGQKPLRSRQLFRKLKE